MELRPYYDRPTAVISDYLGALTKRSKQTILTGALRTKASGQKASTERVSYVATCFPSSVHLDSGLCHPLAALVHQIASLSTDSDGHREFWISRP